MRHPAFADHHVHLGLVDVSRLAASGIGRVVDLGWSDDVADLAAAAPVHAEYAGRFVAAPGGYPGASRWAPPRCTSEVAEPRDAAAAVMHQVALGAAVVKTTLNRDAGPVPDVATLSAVVVAAAEAGLPVVAHAQGPGMVELALAAGVPALAHTPWTHRLDDEVRRGGRRGGAGLGQHAGHPWLRHEHARPGPGRRQPGAFPRCGWPGPLRHRPGQRPAARVAEPARARACSPTPG